MRSPVVLVILLVLAVSGCNGSSEPASTAPSQTSPSQASVPASSGTASPGEVSALPTPRVLEPGVMVHEVSWGGGTDDVWIYLPDSSERLEEESLPCILIAPAGSYGFLGMKLGESDRPEHLPYVKAGFAVVAYALDGYVDYQRATAAEVVQGAKAYMNAKGGLKNASLALDYALEKVPAIDENRIFAAGHSSAATIALCVTARESRVKGCVAYAPGWTDLKTQLHPQIVELLTGEITEYKAFLTQNSPVNYLPELSTSLFVFHAKDDSMVPIQQTSDFVDALRRSNVDVTFVKATQGDHYNSMVHEGIPLAIEWLGGRGGSVDNPDPSSRETPTDPRSTPRVESKSTPQLRMWTDNSGEFQVSAELVGYESKVAKLRKADGSIIEVPVDRLSEEDRQYLREVQR